MKKKFLSVFLAAALALGLTACGQEGEEKDSSAASTESSQVTSEAGSQAKGEEPAKPDTIKLGLVGENNQVWDSAKERFEKDTGIKLEYVVFTDYNQPNEALVSGDLDLNSFQHNLFLDDWNKTTGNKLTTIGNTYLAPLAIFSQKIKDIKDVPEGASVAIPDDPSNGARSLFLLQEAGLIKVKGQPGDLITLEDISENPKKLEIKELDASQTARALDSVDLACVNDEYSIDAGLNPKKDSLFLEPVGDSTAPYINVVACRPEDKDNYWYKKLVEDYYETEESAKVMEEAFKGSRIPAWDK